MSMTVLQPGVLALLQDSGRRGLHRLGMTTGGPLDGEAYHFCNRLLANPVNSTVIEISVGGLQLEAQVNRPATGGAGEYLYLRDGRRHAAAYQR